MSNVESIYMWLLQQNVAAIQEITERYREHNEAATVKYVYDKVIAPLTRQGKAQRIRRGLYTAVDPLTGKPAADPIVVASKLRSEYYMGYHTALTLHGAAYSATAQIQVCVKPNDNFKEFNYGDHTIKPIYTSDTDTNIQVLRYHGHGIRICGKERLLLECLDKPRHVGGWEQTLKSLETLHRGVLGGGSAAVALWRLHLDDLGSHVGEEHGAEWAREVLGQIDYPYAV